jgi:hypothetical protein
MSEDNSCPVDLKTVDKNLVRSNAFFVFAIIMIYILTKSPVYILIILTDFAIRIFPGVKYSPVSQIIKYFLKKANIKAQLIDAWPKVFAAKIGLILALFITFLHFTNFQIPALIFAFIFLIASGLEAFFDFCLACAIYPYYKKFLKLK